MVTLTLVAFVLVSSSSGSMADDPRTKQYGPWTGSAIEVDRLIQQLGSQRMGERDAAKDALLHIGERAFDAVAKAAKDDKDPEIRSRAILIRDLIIKQMTGFGAWLTSSHSVYTTQEPVDLEFWVRPARGPILPGLEVRNAEGKLLPEKMVNGRTLVTIKDRKGKDGRIPADPPSPGKLVVGYTEAIPDLRLWYGISKPGTYYIRFKGLEELPNVRSHIVASNVLALEVCERIQGANRVIPLKSIWAYRMPGTRQMDETFTMSEGRREYVAPEGRVLNDIRKALRYNPRRHPIAQPGFVVTGQGIKALEEAHEVLVNGKKASGSFRRESEASLVFFSYQGGYYVHIVQVEQRGPVFQITYSLVPHNDRELSEHLAIIPLGKLSKGSFQVIVKPLIKPGDVIPINLVEYIPETVCRSFGFRVD